LAEALPPGRGWRYNSKSPADHAAGLESSLTPRGLGLRAGPRRASGALPHGSGSLLD